MPVTATIRVVAVTAGPVCSVLPTVPLAVTRYQNFVLSALPASRNWVTLAPTVVSGANVPGAPATSGARSTVKPVSLLELSAQVTLILPLPVGVAVTPVGAAGAAGGSGAAAS